MTARDNVRSSDKSQLSRGRYVAATNILRGAGVIATITAGVLILRPSGLIEPGVAMFGAGLGGQNASQAAATLSGPGARLQSVPIILAMTDPDGSTHTFATDARHMGLALNISGSVASATAAGSPSFASSLVSRVTGVQTVDVPPVGSAVSERALHVLREAALHLNRLPVDARILAMRNGGLGLRHDKPGLVVDIQASYAAVTSAWTAYLARESAIQSGSAATPSNSLPTPPSGGAAVNTPVTGSAGAQSETLPPLKIDLVTKPAEAAITYKMLAAINGELSSFVTYYMVGARGDNVALAASRINGTVLMPGQVFSYNKTVGPRVASDGFKPAPVIIDGELKPGMGGGVCQPSSTLYNAVLLAGLKVVERVHHGFPVHYLPPGRDATVAYGAIDFQFENSSQWPIYISAHGNGGVLQFTLFGHRIPGQTIEMVHAYTHYGDVPVETVPDYSLRPGQHETERDGHPDIRALWYRITKLDGRVINREPIMTHYYPFPTVVEVGAVRPRVVGTPALATRATRNPVVPASPGPHR